MIFHRVTAHFRKQEWTAIAPDFVIVVTGVFVGIQVANWNEARADERRGAAFVQRLIADLTTDYQKRSSLLAYYDAVYASAVRAIELLNALTGEDRLLVVSTYRATELAYDPQTRATWDEIVSSGEIGLLPRKAVQEGLNVYYAVDVAEQARQEISNSRLRALVRSIIQHRVQAAIRAGCSDIVADDGRVLGFVAECRLDVPDGEIAAAADILKANPQLLHSLTFHVSALSSARNNLRGDVFSIGQSIALLKEAGSAGAPLEDIRPARGAEP